MLRHCASCHFFPLFLIYEIVIPRALIAQDLQGPAFSPEKERDSQLCFAAHMHTYAWEDAGRHAFRHESRGRKGREMPFRRGDATECHTSRSSLALRSRLWLFAWYECSQVLSSWEGHGVQMPPPTLGPAPTFLLKSHHISAFRVWACSATAQMQRACETLQPLATVPPVPGRA